jgi:hypothetical protein
VESGRAHGTSGDLDAGTYHGVGLAQCNYVHGDLQHLCNLAVVYLISFFVLQHTYIWFFYSIDRNTVVLICVYSKRELHVVK